MELIKTLALIGRGLALLALPLPDCLTSLELQDTDVTDMAALAHVEHLPARLEQLHIKAAGSLKLPPQHALPRWSLPSQLRHLHLSNLRLVAELCLPALLETITITSCSWPPGNFELTVAHGDGAGDGTSACSMTVNMHPVDDAHTRQLFLVPPILTELVVTGTCYAIVGEGMS